MISTRKFDTRVGSIIQWILKGSTQPLKNDFKMHEHKIFNHKIYHKCVQKNYPLCLYKHPTAYLLPCIICKHSEHSTSIKGSALSALISIITTPVLISCVDYQHCKGFRSCDKNIPVYTTDDMVHTVLSRSIGRNPCINGYQTHAVYTINVG